MNKQKQATKYLHLEWDEYTYVTREADPDDEWDSDDKCTTWSVHGITLSDNDGSKALPADFSVQAGDTVWVVYAVYSTADTFHHHTGAYLEVLSFHKNESKARRNAQAAHNTPLKIEFDNEKVLERHCPWDGYFESLDYVDVKSFVVSEH